MAIEQFRGQCQSSKHIECFQRSPAFSLKELLRTARPAQSPVFPQSGQFGGYTWLVGVRTGEEGQVGGLCSVSFTWLAISGQSSEHHEAPYTQWTTSQRHWRPSPLGARTAQRPYTQVHVALAPNQWTTTIAVYTTTGADDTVLVPRATTAVAGAP